jgi:restriction system protein
MPKSKATQLEALVAKRRAAIWVGYGNLAEYGYECDFVSPYTKSASNLDAAVFVMLQDWTSVDNNIHGPDETAARLGYTPSLPTNVRLDRLLQTHFGLKRSDTYATNLFPFIKPGGLSARLPRRHLLKAAEDFGWPQINVISPKLVIALGLETFDALRKTAKLRRVGRLNDAIHQPFDNNGIRVWCQAHTGSRGTVNAGGSLAVEANWRLMASWFHQQR